MSSLKPFSDVDVSQINGNIDRSDIRIRIVCIAVFDNIFLNILFA